MEDCWVLDLDGVGGWAHFIQFLHWIAWQSILELLGSAFNGLSFWPAPWCLIDVFSFGFISVPSCLEAGNWASVLRTYQYVYWLCNQYLLPWCRILPLPAPLSLHHYHEVMLSTNTYKYNSFTSSWAVASPLGIKSAKPIRQRMHGITESTRTWTSETSKSHWKSQQCQNPHQNPLKIARPTPYQ